MKYNLLGRTGLKVSALSLGTVELGMDYGIKKSERSNRPDADDAINIIRCAVDMGINFFDTAPDYGTSERLLGEAIGSRTDCYIATKVSIPDSNGKQLTGRRLKQEVNSSLEKSLRALCREALDIVQVHNATEEVIKQGEITEVLLKAQEAGKVRFIGASVYGEEAASAVINDGAFDVIQVAYSLLDQRMARHVLPLAKASQVGVMNRSALLKGVLTTRAKWLPDELSALRYASERVINTFGISWDALPETALRFCLSSGFIHTVLVGINSRQELERAISAASENPLDENRLKMAEELGLDDETIVNPSYWAIS